MDPDLLNQWKFSGKGVDLWALGIILLLFVTGGVPFWGDNEAEIFRRFDTPKYLLPAKGCTFEKIENE
mgnify:CR=1 FL=1